jgi:hypothetical protein
MGFSKAQTIHKTKRTALEIARQCRQENIKYRIRKLKNGYRVDKDWS